jgi:hypothetical protein
VLRVGTVWALGVRVLDHGAIQWKVSLFGGRLVGNEVVNVAMD